MKQAWLRLYGESEQQGSFGSIVRGYAEGFRQAGAMVDLFETNSVGEEDLPGGATAPLAIGFGVPNRAYLMQRAGSHAWRGWMVAPNSTFVPQRIFKWIDHGAADVLAPSRWAAQVMRALVPGLRVHVLPHGVPAAWRRLRPRATQYTDTPWRALHVTSTAGDRKCTAETVAAFEALAASGDLGEDPQLVVKADWMTSSTLLASGAVDPGSKFVRVVDEFVDRDWASFVRRFDCVVQPSRAEGFGLVPLEALALGVPVVATGCTGHEAYLDSESRSWAAAVVVEHGPDAPLYDDGDGASAPEVRQEAIEAALRQAYLDREPLDDQAEKTRLEWVKRFGYDVVCGLFVEYAKALL